MNLYLIYMKTILLLLTIAVVLQASPLCKMCVELTELLQGTLIKVTPMFVVKDMVKSVCERQCTKTIYID